MAEFRSKTEFKECLDWIFQTMSDDPEMGPQLRDANVPQRFEFDDLDLVMNVRAATEKDGGACLVWVWTDDIDWQPRVRMTMSSETANKYFQGKENIPMAIARRRIKTGGDVRASLAVMPITKPVFELYRDYVKEQHPHLSV